MTKKILVIDDENLITRSLEKLFTKSGYKVTALNSGIDAVEQIQNESFDLIISDIRMPWLNGIEAVNEIKNILKLKYGSEPPIIFITGYADKEQEENAKKLKPIAYLHKPVDIKELLEIIKESIGENNHD